MTDYGHPLRFGTFVTPLADDPDATVARAVLAEDLGLDLVTFQDHSYQPRFLDTWTLLSYVASATERIHVAPNVATVPMRPPAVLARAAASLDLLSDGRVDLALGAGAFWDAMEATGVPRLSAGQSVDALAEAIGVIRAIWGEDVPGARPAGARGGVVLPGEHHRLAGAEPGPGTTRRIPLWLGALGPRMLRLTGESADGWLPSFGRVGVDGLRAGNAAIDAAATAAGRDPREITRVLNVAGVFDDDGAVPRGTGEPDVSGPPEAWVERLLPLVVDEGVSTLVLASDDERTTQRFAEEVVPALRAEAERVRAAAGTDTSRVVPAQVRARRRAGIDYDAVPPSLAERVVEPGDAAHAAVRSTYLRGGSPGLVLRPRDTAEVVEALAYARAQEVTRRVPLSVRSGGHGISGRSTNDGGIVLDLGALAGIEVLDDAARLVRLGPAARWGDVATALAPRGWAITSGDSGGVGVGGLATAGGIGFLGRAHGLTIDHVRAVETVLADGRVVRASADENTDLFWGVRGAGANLGVVTSFELVADEVGDVGFAQMVHDASDTAAFLQRWGATVEASPRDTTSFLLMGRPRPGQPVVAQTMTMVDSDDPDTVLDRLRPYAAIAPLLQQATAQIVPYAAVVQAPPPGPHHGEGEPVARSGLLEHVTPEAAARLAGLVASGDTFFFQIRSTGGTTSDVPADATAYAHRTANFAVSAMGASRARLDARWDAIADVFTGSYLSFETDPRPERVEDAFPPATLDRLRALKRRVDPGNLFRDNFSVLGPAAVDPHPADEAGPLR
ncbi:LLM class flavin-dependent oxidoreductase [Cellulosimicrobium marinum]|uniref:LLM class flavin-dependent oxidoreductase n=1 Tax=Cellulosimicrobium marinum TaxID=1638992 RepID=UPI001E340572|nr:LLM class flavin-dependent oxidoreductase [Cellulosimicrobium marinum]MCB7136143.1 LLM class flavin-dependent oxidoreductase [Cellulosimicrobium marinum]